MISSQITSAISVVTFYDLLNKARPGITNDKPLSVLLAPAEVDVHDKVDLVLRLGDSNPYAEDREIVRLVQLKTSRRGGIHIWRLDDPEAVPDDAERYIKKEHMEKMRGYAARLERDSNGTIDAQTYLVTVPPYDDPAIGNVFGIVVDPVLISEFSQQGKFGLLPSEKPGKNDTK